MGCFLGRAGRRTNQRIHQDLKLGFRNLREKPIFSAIVIAMLDSVGIAAGLAGAFTAATLLRSVLFGVSPYDPRTYAVVIVAVLCIGFAAILVPALRASRIDPIRTLRSE